MTVLTISQDTLIMLPDGATGGTVQISYNGTTVGPVIASGDDQGRAVIVQGRLAKLTALDGKSPLQIAGREAGGRLPARVTLRIYPAGSATVAPIILSGLPVGSPDAPGIWDLSNIDDASGGLDVVLPGERQAIAVLRERTAIAADQAEAAARSASGAEAKAAATLGRLDSSISSAANQAAQQAMEGTQQEWADIKRDTAQGTSTAIAQAAAMAGRKTTDVPDNIPLDSTDLYVMLDSGYAGEVWKRDAANGPATRRREFEAVGSGQLEAVAQTAANLKTGAIEALAQAQPVQPGDVASAGNSNFRHVKLQTAFPGVSLDLATDQQARDTQGYAYVASYFLRDPQNRFVPGHVGLEVMGDGIPAGTIIVRYNGPDQVWISQPATRKGATDVQLRHRRWGRHEIPLANGNGAWRFEYEYEGAERAKIYAWDHGFRPGNSKDENRAALQKTLDYAAMKGFDVVVLPPGDSACAPGLNLSANISIHGEGQCRVDLVGNGSTPLLTIGESYTKTLDLRGASFTRITIGSIRGVIFFSSGERSGVALAIGNNVTTDTVAGAGYKIIQCGFDRLETGMVYLNNNWCIDVAWSFFWDNNTHVKHEGTHNSGENLTFTNTHFAQCPGYAFILSGGGAGFVFERCSFDYNVSGFIFRQPGYVLRFAGCWIEFSSGNHFMDMDFASNVEVYPQSAGYGTAVYFSQTLLARNGANAGKVANHTLGPVPIRLRDCSIWRTVDGKRTLEHDGPRILTIPEGQDRLQVPMEWVSELAPPTVIALNQPGGWWWVECPPAKAGVGHDSFVIALQSPAPAGGARFSVDY